MKTRFCAVVFLFTTVVVMVFGSNRVYGQKIRGQIVGVERVLRMNNGRYLVRMHNKKNTVSSVIVEHWAWLTDEKYTLFGKCWEYRTELVRSTDETMSVVLREYKSTKEIVTTIYISPKNNEGGDKDLDRGEWFWYRDSKSPPLRGTATVVGFYEARPHD